MSRLNENNEHGKNVVSSFYNPLPFFKLLFAKKYLSLDINANEIRYTVLKKTGGHIQVEKWGEEKLPVNEIEADQALSIAIENIRNEAFSAGMIVTASIYSPDINTREIILPKIEKKSDLKKAIYFKNKSELHNFDENSVWTYEVLEEFIEKDLPKLRILICVIPKKTILKYIAVFQNAKIELQGLIPRFAALHTAFRQMVPLQERDILIDISTTFSQLCYFKGGKLSHIRNIGIGSNNLDINNISRNNSVDLYKDTPHPASQTNPDGDSILGSRLKKRLELLKEKQDPVFHSFFSEVMRFIAFIQGKTNKNFIEHIYVSGSGIKKEGLIPYLQNRLKMPVNIILPCFSPSDTKRNAGNGEFLAALGVSLHPGDMFNFIPKEYKTKKIYTKLNWLLLTIIFFSSLGLSYFSSLRESAIENQLGLIRQYQEEYQSVALYEKNYNNCIAEITQLRNERNKLNAHISRNTPIVQILKLFSNEIPDEIQLYKLKIFKPETGNQQQNDTYEGQMISFNIILSGVIKGDPVSSNVILINFINHLNSLKYFKQIKLLEKQKGIKKPGLSFKMELSL